MHHVSPPEKNKLVIEVNDHGTWCMVDNMVHILNLIIEVMAEFHDFDDPWR